MIPLAEECCCLGKNLQFFIYFQHSFFANVITILFSFEPHALYFMTYNASAKVLNHLSQGVLLTAALWFVVVAGDVFVYIMMHNLF